MSYSNDAATARIAIVKQIADEFMSSNIEYTCNAVVHDFAKQRYWVLIDNPDLARFYRLRSWKERNILSAVTDEVHRRWKNV